MVILSLGERAMVQKQVFQALFKAIFILTAAVILNGCSEKPIPPVFNLYGYQRVAVVPFDNQTQDPALARAVQDEMTDEILNLGAVPVIDAKQVAAYLRSVGADAPSVQTDSDLRNRVAKKFNCDLLLLGSAANYAEILKDTAPEKVTNQSTGISKWGFYTYRKVIVNANAKLMDPATGSLIWSGKNKGWSWLNTWNPLPVPDDVAAENEVNRFLNLANVVGRSVANPQVGQALDLANLVRYRLNHDKDKEPTVIDETNQGTLVYPKSAAFADLRQKAVYQTMNGIVEDFRGHCGWTPQLRGNAN
jgi:PBP1b-binding outer membrane lipoprotein LpoB